jgi:hypothetical protein
MLLSSTICFNVNQISTYYVPLAIEEESNSPVDLSMGARLPTATVNKQPKNPTLKGEPKCGSGSIGYILI